MMKFNLVQYIFFIALGIFFWTMGSITYKKCNDEPKVDPNVEYLRKVDSLQRVIRVNLAEKDSLYILLQQDSTNIQELFTTIQNLQSRIKSQRITIRDLERMRKELESRPDLEALTLLEKINEILAKHGL